MNNEAKIPKVSGIWLFCDQKKKKNKVKNLTRSSTQEQSQWSAPGYPRAYSSFQFRDESLCELLNLAQKRKQQARNVYRYGMRRDGRIYGRSGNGSWMDEKAFIPLRNKLTRSSEIYYRALYLHCFIHISYMDITCRLYIYIYIYVRV